MDNRRCQIVLAVSLLVLFGYHGMGVINEVFSYYMLTLNAVKQILLGVFLFLIGAFIRWSGPSSAREMVRKSIAAVIGLALLGYALAFPCQIVSVILSRLIMAIIIVYFLWRARGKVPQRWGEWLRLVGQVALVFVLTFVFIRNVSYGFRTFHCLRIHVAMITVKVAELMAWSFVPVIAWFAKWLAERPDDLRSLAQYWAVVGVCCIVSLFGHLAGITCVLFGAGVVGAVFALSSLSGRPRMRMLVVQIGYVMGLLAAFLAIVWIFFPEGPERLRGFVFSEEYRYSLGYSYAKLDRLIQRLSFGKEVPGYLAANEFLPDAFRGFFLVTTAALWGWKVVLLFVALSCWLFTLLLDGCRRIGSLPFRAAAGVLTSVLMLQFVGGLLANAGCLPMVNVCQPFTSSGVMPFCANALYLGLLFRLFPSASIAARHYAVWPLALVPLTLVLMGGGFYAWRQSETRFYRQELHSRQAQLCANAITEAEKVLEDIQSSGKLGEYGVSVGVDRSSILSRIIGGMIFCLEQQGRSQEASQRVEKAITLVLNIQKDDTEVLADLLGDYAGCLDRMGDFGRSGLVYKEANDMRLRMKRKEVPEVVGRVVYVDYVRPGTLGYRHRLCWGDQVLSYDGVSVLDARQLANRMRFDTEQAQTGGTRLIVKRNGRDEDVVFSQGVVGIDLRNGWLFQDGHVECCRE